MAYQQGRDPENGSNEKAGEGNYPTNSLVATLSPALQRSYLLAKATQLQSGRSKLLNLPLSSGQRSSDDSLMVSRLLVEADIAFIKTQLDRLKALRTQSEVPVDLRVKGLKP